MLSEYNGNPLLNNKNKREVISKNYDYTSSQNKILIRKTIICSII
jgi:hypothetical protein